MTTLLYRSLVCLFLGVALAGCDEPLESDLEDEIAEDIDARQIHTVCPKCALNSSTVNGWPFGPLDLTGPNEDGVMVEHMLDPDGNRYEFGVHDEELAAYDGDELIAYGAKLSGWDMVFLIKGERRTITISGRKEEASWAKNGAPIGSYGLEGTFDDGPPRSMCPNQGGTITAVTVIHGETYDGALKRVDKIGEQWVTLACVEEAAYKLKRLGYGPHGNQGPDGEPATVAQRNATIKMLTADFCGTGQSFTGYHKQFFWQNPSRTATNGDPKQAVLVEAVWTEKGAACLSNPRYGTYNAIKAVCQLPLCEVYMATKPSPTYEWKTFIPYWLMP